ncbi:hypothetical protein [Streptomyces sp. NPDC050264]|uniref:hypothetical protein n=1 Tax=Streptomyces sp. NPDC050264 TaxID=3155038 RepID=UPI003449B53A
MAAESFSAQSETLETGESLVSTPVHWGTAQLAAPPDQIPGVDIGITHEGAAPAPPMEPAGAPAVETAADAEAVEELIRIAVVSRPLNDVADLVTRLEQTPDGTPTAESVLRLAAVARSVEDVTQLVELLGPPEHPADHMDEAIRHAAKERPTPEVTRLIQLLSCYPHDPHSGAEAVHAAATSRSVEDLMQLIGGLSENRHGGAPVVSSTPAALTAPPADAEPARPAPDTPAQASQPRKRQNGATPQVWLRWAAGVLMLLCAAAHLPLNWSQGSAFSVSAAIGVSAICAAAGVALCLSRSLAVAVASALVAGALAIGHLLANRLTSGSLAQVLRPENVPAPLPTLAAVAATLAALLIVALTVAGLRTSAAGRTPDPGV